MVNGELLERVDLALADATLLQGCLSRGDDLLRSLGTLLSIHGLGGLEQIKRNQCRRLMQYRLLGFKLLSKESACVYVHTRTAGEGFVRVGRA